MSAYVYVDVSRKQEYIYRHNLLRHNLLNSGVIKIVTEDFSEEDQFASQFPLSLRTFLDDNYKNRQHFEFSGGGNSIISFLDVSEARSFVRTYSAEVIRHYPELELYMSIVDDSEVTTTNNKDRQIRDMLIQRADQYKDQRRSAFRRWTYGIEEIDHSGKAKAKDNEAWLVKEARSLLSEKLKQKLDLPSVTLTEELQKYKQNGRKKNYIGVISIDGNRMGEMVNKLHSFSEWREFSHTIEEIYQVALTEALYKHSMTLPVDAATGKDSPLLFTPVVQAGDDICIIVEGVHAIAIAGSIVRHIHQISMEPPYRERLTRLGIHQSLSACAGVAIVKVAYPFFDAVQAAEALCHRAKEAMHMNVEANSTMPANACFIDWEIVEGQFMAQHDYTRYVQHQRNRERFHIKPLRIDQAEVYKQGHIGFDAFVTIVNRLQALPDKGSFVEQIKSVMYTGWDSYKFLFERNKLPISANICKIVEDVFADVAVNPQYGALIPSKNEMIYVLNDVIEAMDFMGVEE